MVVCGSPTPLCQEYRSEVAGRLSAWLRLANIAEIGSNRVLDMRLLSKGDVVYVWMTGAVGEPLAGRNGRREDSYISFEVLGVDSQGLVSAAIFEDNMFDSPEDDEPEDEYEEAYMTWPMEEGQQITIIGSCEDTAEWHGWGVDCKSMSRGFLHVGRALTFQCQDETHCLAIIQEIEIQEATGVTMKLFDTVPTQYRPPYSDRT
jgi:hypothetical protein